MSLNEYQILLIDDDDDDHVHIQDLLKEIRSAKYGLTWKSTYMDGLKALKEKKFDACLLDYKLGEKTGLELLVEAHSQGLKCPVIFLTGMVDFEIDIQAMQMGASDYLVKGQLTGPLLERSIRYSIKHRHDLEEIQEGRAKILQQDRLASLGLMASSLAHEIGTPLGVIRSRAELASKRASDSAQVQENVNIVITQIDRITKLVNSLLHLARGSKSDFATAIEMDPVFDTVLSLLEHEFGRKGIAIRKDIDPHLQVKAESGPLGQVLINLLINAMHAIEEVQKIQPAQDMKISISAKDKGKQVEIAIVDTGIGISEDNMQNLFKPFFTTKEIGHGTGLGLATSMGIVNSWGGEILVSSEKGVGSCFRILLPKP